MPRIVEFARIQITHVHGVKSTVGLDSKGDGNVFIEKKVRESRKTPLSSHGKKTFFGGRRQKGQEEEQKDQEEEQKDQEEEQKDQEEEQKDQEKEQAKEERRRSEEKRESSRGKRWKKCRKRGEEWGSRGGKT